MWIDLNDEQLKNAFFSIRLSFDPDSNVNDESDSQEAKEFSARDSSWAGRQIDCNAEQFRNACDSIRVSLDPDSHANEERDVQPWKQSAFRISIS
jgi:hypothetical protein